MIQKLSHRINQWVEYLLFGLGLSMSLLVAVQVFFRYGLNQSLFWSEELARFFLVWLTFLGAASAYYRGVNPGVDFLYARMPDRIKKAFSILTHLFSIALFMIMVIYGIKFAWFVRLQVTAALQIPKWMVLSVIPASGTVLAFHAVVKLFDALKDFKGRTG